MCYLFFALLTTILAISDFIALLTFLFFIFETPNLNMFGMLSIPLFINLLPKSEPIAFDTSSNPAFARFDASSLPSCTLL